MVFESEYPDVISRRDSTIVICTVVSLDVASCIIARSIPSRPDVISALHAIVKNVITFQGYI